MIQIYKPTPRNTGMAMSVKAGDTDGHFYVEVLKQFSWDSTRNKGSFVENRKKPGKNTIMKFNQVEAANWIDSIERYVKFSGFHGIESRKTSFSFELAEGNPAASFFFKINQTNAEDTTQKDSYFIPISFAEARLIKEYLIHYLHKAFARQIQKPQTSSPAPEQAPPIEEDPLDTSAAPRQVAPAGSGVASDTSDESATADW